MKKIRLIPVEIEEEGSDDYEEMGVKEGKSWSFEFDLTPYIVTCAMACAILFVTRFVQKHILKTL